MDVRPPEGSTPIGVGSRRPYLYVGNLDARVTERALADLFSEAGAVRSAKIVNPSQSRPFDDSVRYGFIEYLRLSSAETALLCFQHRRFHGRKLRLNWAHQGACSGEPAAVLPDPLPMLADEARPAPPLLSRYPEEQLPPPSRMASLESWLDDLHLPSSTPFVGSPPGSNAPLSGSRVLDERRPSGSLSLRELSQPRALPMQETTRRTAPSLIDASRVTRHLSLSPDSPLGGGGLATSPTQSSFSASATSAPPIDAGGTPLHTVFVGDVAPEINDATLAHAFSIFPSMYDARIMWDIRSHRSRGYGFVRFTDESDAVRSISRMTGYWLGSRSIRVNWASRRPRALSASGPSCEESEPTTDIQHPLSYETALQSAAPHVTTIYVGNLPSDSTLTDFVPSLERYGRIVHAQVHQSNRYAFITFDTHESAARAIAAFSSQPLMVHGRISRTGWGRYARMLPSQSAGGAPDSQ